MTFYGLVDQVRKKHEGAEFDSDAFRAAGRRVARTDLLRGARAGDADRARGLHAVRPELARPRGARRGVPAGAVHRPDGAADCHRADPHRRADLRQPGVSRRHPRRPRLDQRHLRRRDQDLLRHLPALLALPFRRARRRGRQRQGDHLQRQGRGPALARPAQSSPDANSIGTATSWALPAGPFQSVGLFAPVRRQSRVPMPDTGSRQEGINPYCWTLREFARDRLLRFAFADAEDARSQISFVDHPGRTRARTSGAQTATRTIPA